METEYLIDGKVHATFHQGSFALEFADGKRAGICAREQRNNLRGDDGTIPPHAFFASASGTLRIVLDGREYRVELGSLRQKFRVGSEVYVGDDLVGVFWIKKILGMSVRAWLDIVGDLEDRNAVSLAHLINFAPADALPILRGETC